MATTRANLPDEPARGVLFGLLMAVMNSIETWTTAASDRRTGLTWRDAVTARMIASAAYIPYEDFVAEAARELALPANSTSDLLDGWREMSPWSDVQAGRADLPRGLFVTKAYGTDRLAMADAAPPLLGFVLGPLLEQHLRRALIISHGDLTVFFTRPISLVLLVVAALALILAIVPSIRRKREVVFLEEPG